ncbi:single-stranded DNA-binding protein [Gordonia sp. HNM0687]|uniref:Single-stranded DNA-binding protein n=1 Tax=Gordonia mangrovi TaxID=2665643 RepID=A0A6L7GNA0_9ACTN|nr:R3H domain-containing nucleic acid-binding protein [Gordonia mangrovi]MXP21390.1 single-stranded DNA-binding protein [Gordonia mangrovi]UVF80139.1 single-stranded DNA-binding protein [Gordonia mangrovi]
MTAETAAHDEQVREIEDSATSNTGSSDVSTDAAKSVAEATSTGSSDDVTETSGSEAADTNDVSDENSDDSAEAAADADATADSDDDSDDDDLAEEDRLVEEGEIAGDYLEQLLDVLDFDGDIDLDVDGDRAVVSIDGGDDLDRLVGRKGEVLDALQELTRLAVQQSTGVRSRLMLDIARWRADRRDRLARLGAEVARRVLDSGEREALDPMTPFERKIVHDAVAAVDGVVSESEGAEPKRRVVVLPTA